YYDFDLPRPLTTEDLSGIEARMRNIVAKDAPFTHWTMPRDEAIQYFTERNQPYKVDLIKGFPDEEVGIYRQNDFVDLCKGPHVESRGKIGPFKLLNVAGAYWRGDEHQSMLQRIYGTAWPTQDGLDQSLHRIEEAARRDHRKLGRELDL